MDTIRSVVDLSIDLSGFLFLGWTLPLEGTPPDDEPPILQHDPSNESGNIVKNCIICGSGEESEDKLLQAPCGQHFVCADDISSFFEHATNNERLFPPRCCRKIFLLHDYEDHVPAEIAEAYRAKAQGEYAILPKHRVYCANPPCSKFLHPALYIKDAQTGIKYAKCSAASCGQRTCVRCKTLLSNQTLQHACGPSEEDTIFQQTVFEKGYQTCFACSATIELAEACNHVTCPCGASFCYICGAPWPGRHGCPMYGPAVHNNAQGYNQNGFHRAIRLDGLGLRRSQRMLPRILRLLQPPHFPALPRLGLMLSVFFIPRMSVALRMGMVLGVWLFPSLVLLLPGGFEYRDDGYAVVRRG